MSSSAKIDRRFDILRTAVSIVIALVIAFILILLATDKPFDAIGGFIVGPFQNLRRFGDLVGYWIPLVFTGVSVCIMHSSGQASMIMEGAFMTGAFLGQIVCLQIMIPVLGQIAAVLTAGIVGGILAFIPAIMKYRWDANEVVSSIMLNNVLTNVILFLVNNFFKDSKQGSNQTPRLPEEMLIPKVIDNINIHYGLFIAIAVLVFGYFFLFKSKWGYAIRMCGRNMDFARYSGMAVGAVILYSQIIGGIVAGIGGATFQLGMLDRYTNTSVINYGWDGIVVAMLANYNPLSVLLSAFFIAYIKKGSDVMQSIASIPTQVSMIVQAILIILIASKLFLEGWRHRAIVKNAERELAKEGN